MAKGYRGLLCGVGINDADYTVCVVESQGVSVTGQRIRKQVWICPFYQKWKGMLTRAYNFSKFDTAQTYAGASVCEEWLTFTKFKAWMQRHEWENKYLDHDLLVPGSTEFNPDTTCLVSGTVNRFLNESAGARGRLPIGVTWDRVHCVLRSATKVAGKRIHLGNHSTVEEAFYSWLNAKQGLAQIVADDEADPRIKPAIIARYENYPIPDFSQFATREELVGREAAQLLTASELFLTA
ncbi:hypothetical protein [Pseudomonas sp. P8_250]|uniref:hypothetical protein n=1 Tax=Pseudomonas sp. P8_250 TaxID=3043446 RepID=UPI002A35FC0F|nr:hypothetical protein [Pseudomonas sp. P8_250]MDX9668716.1 hypothetical protein [Pseudomonas sp. P8_250]